MTTIAEGECTEAWAMRQPGFFGSVKQLTCCARCGGDLPHGKHKKRRMFAPLKPSMHFICDACFEALPD